MSGEAPFDVAIVGFGPTGATLAGLLGQLGRRVVVMEREAEVYQLPRAVHFDHEVMRTFQTLGAADAILPFTRTVRNAEFRGAGGEVLIRIPLDVSETDQGWASDYFFHQPSLERALRDRAEGMPNVTLRLAGFEGFEQEADGVTLRGRAADGSPLALRARYLVGCDGSSSAVRNALGIGLEDLAFDEPWVVVDLRGAEGLPEDAVQVCDPARPTTLVPCALGHYRFEFMLRPDDPEQEMARPEQLRKLLARWIDPDSVELVRAAVYRFHGLVAERWRAGRVMIAGDAAHQTPPFLGQGMCAGIRDAANLGWKLDRVLRHAASERLLDSYESERKPHARELIERAIAAGRIVCTQDAEVARARDAAMLSDASAGERFATALPLLGEGCFDTHTPHPLVRGLSPQPEVSTSAGPRRLDDVTGASFRLVLRDGRGVPEGDAAERLARREGRVLVWSDEEGEAPPGALHARSSRAHAAEAFFERHKIHAFLARPDHAVFGVATTPDEVAGLIERLDAALG